MKTNTYALRTNRSNIEEEELAFPEEVEEKPAVGTIIVPPKGSIAIQDMVIRNLTDVDLEFWLRLNEELKELAVSKIG